MAATDPNNLPGLKERELIALGPCAICRKPQLGADVTFYKVTISRGMFNRAPIQRRAGLELLLGGSVALAQVMGPNEDLAKIFDGPHDVFVHEHCAHEIGSLLFLVPKSEDEEADAITLVSGAKG